MKQSSSILTESVGSVSASLCSFCSPRATLETFGRRQTFGEMFPFRSKSSRLLFFLSMLYLGRLTRPHHGFRQEEDRSFWKERECRAKLRCRWHAIHLKSDLNALRVQF